MSIDTDVYAVMSGYAPLTALVGSGSAVRVYPSVIAQGVAMPAVAYALRTDTFGTLLGDSFLNTLRMTTAHSPEATQIVRDPCLCHLIVSPPLLLPPIERSVLVDPALRPVNFRPQFRHCGLSPLMKRHQRQTKVSQGIEGLHVGVAGIGHNFSLIVCWGTCGSRAQEISRRRSKMIGRSAPASFPSSMPILHRCCMYSSIRSAFRSRYGTCRSFASTNRLSSFKCWLNSSVNFSCS